MEVSSIVLYKRNQAIKKLWIDYLSYRLDLKDRENLEKLSLNQIVNWVLNNLGTN
jgi:hypothetical protein